jgi:hypothetical protein
MSVEDTRGKRDQSDELGSTDLDKVSAGWSGSDGDEHTPVEDISWSGSQGDEKKPS